MHARIIRAALATAVGLAVAYAWSTWVLPVARMLAESPQHGAGVTIAVTVPLAIAAGCLLVGAVHGLRAVDGLGPVGRWAGRAAFSLSALLGALVVVLAAVLLTGE